MIEKLDPSSGASSDEWDFSDVAENNEASQETLPSPEIKEKVLTFENLSRLTTEQYLEVWKKLNPFYVTHVTRQGIRDHSGMVYHSAGVGEFQNGAKDVFADQKTLRSPAEANYSLPPNFTKEDVGRALDIMVFSDEEYSRLSPHQILYSLPFNSTLASADPWADKQAIHFAQHTVLDELYGGESGNEIFYVFPTDVVASQCQFGGHMHENLTTAQVSYERKWNDIFVWPKDGEIPLDAGLVFLPKSTMVDRGTGSVYATREFVDADGKVERAVERDEERIGRFKEWLSGLSDESPEMVAIREQSDYSLAEEKLKEIGIPDGCFDGLLRYGNHGALLQAAKLGYFSTYHSGAEIENTPKEELFDTSVRKFLASHNADLKSAEDTVTAEEYWEEYFQEHPEQKPAHVIYYDGDPSSAIRDFLSENGVLEETGPQFSWDNFRKQYDDSPNFTGPGDSSERDGGMLGFDEHYIGDGTEDEKMQAEHKRFNELALEILKEKLGQNNDSSSVSDIDSSDF